jgi:hypothetical protein
MVNATQGFALGFHSAAFQALRHRCKRIHNPQMPVLAE